MDEINQFIGQLVSEEDYVGLVVSYGRNEGFVVEWYMKRTWQESGLSLEFISLRSELFMKRYIINRK